MTKHHVASKSAFQRPALYALSIAFTASIVSYPDLPRDIPPLSYVDGEQVFWGGPFLAFFLPIASIVIWWLLDRLDSHSRESTRSIESAGAKTALFLAAFHMTMLIGLIGSQVWLTRVLGLMIGMFMIVSRDRMQRLSGYIRGMAGIAICIASLFGLGIARIIVVAAFLEAAVYVAPRLLLSLRKRSAVGALLLCCCGTAIRADAQGLAPGTIETLPAFFDATVPKLMQERHVAGTAVIVVNEGRVVFARGYGNARLDSDISVEPSRTLFRIGSVTKLFTAIAAIQLAEAGRLDLQRDVREYLPDVPLRYATTTHQLLTHTAGLDERFAGAYTDSPERLQRLPEHLRRYTPEQVFRPGTASSYSNYNYALVGLVVERLSGVAYEQYIADRIFRPMKMTSTTALQPPAVDVNHDLARGYRWAGRQEPIPYNYTQAAPAGAMTTTVTDMGRFMLAVLAGGSLDGERILSPTSLRMLLETQYTPHPLIPGTTYGFSPMTSHGQRLLYRGGTLGDQAAMLVLAPSDKLGIFIASNALPGIGDFLFEPMMTHLGGPETSPAPPQPIPDAARRAARFEGTYRAYRQVRNEMSRLRALMPVSQSRVIAEPDGTLRWQGRRWLEIEPLLFRSVNSLDYILFRENASGEIVGVGDFERIGWREQASFHVGLLLSCVLAFLTYLMSRVLRALKKRRPASPEGRFARVCAVFVAITNLAFVVGLALLIRDLGAITPLPLPILLWLSLPLASVAVTALLPAFAATSWKEKWWTRRERFGYSLFVILAVAFMTSLNYWKLLGIRY